MRMIYGASFKIFKHVHLNTIIFIDFWDFVFMMYSWNKNDKMFNII